MLTRPTIEARAANQHRAAIRQVAPITVGVSNRNRSDAARTLCRERRAIANRRACRNRFEKGDARVQRQHGLGVYIGHAGQARLQHVAGQAVKQSSDAHQIAACRRVSVRGGAIRQVLPRRLYAARLNHLPGCQCLPG